MGYPFIKFHLFMHGRYQRCKRLLPYCPTATIRDSECKKSFVTSPRSWSFQNLGYLLPFVLYPPPRPLASMHSSSAHVFNQPHKLSARAIRKEQPILGPKLAVIIVRDPVAENGLADATCRSEYSGSGRIVPFGSIPVNSPFIASHENITLLIHAGVT